MFRNVNKVVESPWKMPILDNFEKTNTIVHGETNGRVLSVNDPPPQKVLWNVRTMNVRMGRGMRGVMATIYLCLNALYCWIFALFDLFDIFASLLLMKQV